MAPGPGPATVARHWCGLMPASVVAKWSQHLYPDTKSVTTTSTSTLDVSSIVVIVLQAVVRQTCVRIFVDILYIFVDNIPQRTHSIHAVESIARTSFHAAKSGPQAHNFLKPFSTCL